MSAAAERAAGIPQIRGAAEEVIRLEPDLVLGGTFTRRETRSLLRRMGYRVVDVPAAESFAAVRTTTRKLAALLGHPERGERLIAALDREIGAAGNRGGAARDPDRSAPTERKDNRMDSRRHCAPR